MAFAYCPDCVARIYLGRKPWLGQPATCHRCGADLEVIHLNPPTVDWTDESDDGDWADEFYRQTQDQSTDEVWAEESELELDKA